MSNLHITNTGQLVTDLNNIKLLVNNFSQTGDITGWTLGGSPVLSNGIVTMSAINPNIQSPEFNVGPKDIIALEFTISLPTPSTSSGANGVYLGSPGSQGVYVHQFNHTTKTWTKSTTANNNPYYLNSYNLTAALTQKHYFLGSEVDLADVPWGETTNSSYTAKAIQLPPNSTVTKSRIRSGYNTNTSMVIELSNVRIYNINQVGFHDSDEITIASFGKNFVNGNQIIEY